MIRGRIVFTYEFLRITRLPVRNCWLWSRLWEHQCGGPFKTLAEYREAANYCAKALGYIK